MTTVVELVTIRAERGARLLVHNCRTEQRLRDELNQCLAEQAELVRDLVEYSAFLSSRNPRPETPWLAHFGVVQVAGGYFPAAEIPERFRSSLSELISPS